MNDVIDSKETNSYPRNMKKFFTVVKRVIFRQPREIESVLAFECSMQWDELLKKEGDESLRFCTNCSKDVYLTISDLAYQENAKWGRCVSIPAGTKLSINDKDVNTPRPLLGSI